jgi:thioredoxin-related protein
MRLMIASAVVLLTAAAVFAEEEAWMTDYAKAAEKAKADNKLLLMDFSGSDWCGWCIKLDKEIFDTKEFKEYAAENLVLLKLDFPKKKTLPPEEKEQNQKLAREYGIKGYPTVIVLSPDGKQVGKLGYMKEGPAAFIEALKKLKQ